MIDKKIDEKEALELKNIFIHYLGKRKEIMKTNKIKVEDIFGEVISQHFISPEQISKHNSFLTKIL